MNTRIGIEQYYKIKHEGDVFVHVHSMINGGDIITSKRYYIVKNGVVREIFDGKIGAETGDSVFDLTYQCIRIGKYNPKFKYLQKTHSCKYSEFCKRNKIK